MRRKDVFGDSDDKYDRARQCGQMSRQNVHLSFNAATAQCAQHTPSSQESDAISNASSREHQSTALLTEQQSARKDSKYAELPGYLVFLPAYRPPEFQSALE